MLYFTEEEEITFAPTYRFERDTRERYAYTKAKATGVQCESHNPCQQPFESCIFCCDENCLYINI